ncbi:hypothetical protein F4803DRAFT_546436 [Xylaria telfairii]|nr:hypothetical protein F4803DRAFT_546436 [Xylaria telfairii]
MQQDGSPPHQPRPEHWRRMSRPFVGLSIDEMNQKVLDFMREAGFPDADRPFIHRGAFLAQDTLRYTLGPWVDDAPKTSSLPSQATSHLVYNRQLIDEHGTVFVDHEERKALEIEAEKINIWGRYRNLWKKLSAYPRPLYSVIICCSLGAMVQGLDQTAVNGAQVFYSKAFGINDSTDRQQTAWLGLVNAAPYLSGAIASFATSSWRTLLAARFLLGLGIGLKSATIPIYATECAPAQLRGGLVMMWQLWTAFGIALGYAFGVAFWGVGGPCRTDGIIALPCSWNWRLMLAVPSLPPILAMLYVFTVPESPRFLIQKANNTSKKNDDGSHQKAQEHYRRAFDSLTKLNPTKLQAARELFLIYHTMQEKHDNTSSVLTPFKEMWKQKRTRRALRASLIVMFFQQYCGINVLTNYSDTIIQLQKTRRVYFETTDSRDPFYFSLGFGLLNWVFSFPALFLIDTLGRRGLLLLTFPFLAIFQALMATTAWVNSFPGLIISMYLFCVFYSLGEGPVPFVYASESMPLHHRDNGMGLTTFVTWIFHFVLTISWPLLVQVWSETAAFSCFVRETKGEKLEEMDRVFLAPGSVHYRFAWRELKWYFEACIKWPFNVFLRSSLVIPDRPIFLDYVEEWEKGQKPAIEIRRPSYSSSGRQSDIEHELSNIG